MEKGDKVKVKGTILEGVITATRLVPASSTGTGTFGDVKMITVKFSEDRSMEYEWTELKKIE